MTVTSVTSVTYVMLIKARDQPIGSVSSTVFEEESEAVLARYP